MQKRIWLIALVAAALLSAPAAQAEDGFYVIAGGGGGVGTKITSLPYTIITPGYYYFGGNLTTSGTGNAITVSVDNVTLDLMGCSLTRTGTGGNPHGIYMSGRTNVEIRNGTITGFTAGIYEASSNGANHRLINIRADYNTADDESIGISLSGKNHLVRGCTASNNGGCGIRVASGTITGCVVCDNGNNSIYGISLNGPGSLLDNIATNTSNAGTGFSIGAIGSTTKILVDGNSAGGNGTNYTASGPGTVWGVNAGR